LTTGTLHLGSSTYFGATAGDHPYADDGAMVMLRPLTPGHHQLYVYGTWDDGSGSVTINLNVVDH
jgi:hypothetical protein